MELRLNIYENIFLLYPELEPIFSSELETKSTEEVSKFVWALILDFHPSSLYKNLSSKARRAVIEDDYLGYSVDWLTAQATQMTLKELCLTKPKQYLVAWEQKLDERQAFIASLPYDQSTYEMLDKMMSSTEKMWKQYMVCLKDVQDEEAQVLGGAQESLSEMGVI